MSENINCMYCEKKATHNIFNKEPKNLCKGCLKFETRRRAEKNRWGVYYKEPSNGECKERNTITVCDGFIIIM